MAPSLSTPQDSDRVLTTFSVDFPVQILTVDTRCKIACVELIANQLKVVEETRQIFSAPHLPFPNFLTGTAPSAEPSRGVLDVSGGGFLPHSISTDLAVFRPRDMFPNPGPGVDPGFMTGLQDLQYNNEGSSYPPPVFYPPVVHPTRTDNQPRRKQARPGRKRDALLEGGKTCMRDEDHAKKSAWEK
ncbi:hypothetical protein B0H13DRAFT_1892420 [Mycena leptocephala]|nr:hypothetical protein B0H13DRAFT_1892420 [Mycena leptocephala]